MAVLLLAACAGGPPPRPPVVVAPADWQAQVEQLAALERWTLAGRVAIRTDADAYSASLHWVQDGPRYTLRLTGPLGRGAVELRGDAAGIVLRTAGDETVTAQDAQELMRTQLGWSLPVAGLRFWVRGIPDPGLAVDGLVFDATGRLRVLEQTGWRIEVERYVEAGSYVLPARLILTSSHASVRMAVNRWTPG
ncbi:MAG: outer membrane lipoprotein LolB [Gammaproteobacteria bacterium]|nr:outer membrane lipoprotein LolB [Gammaproteobacteria bacterium]